MPLNHRPATSEDFATICHFAQNADELFFAFPKARYPLTPDQLAEAVAQRADATVVEEDGQIVAFANFYLWEQGGTCALGNVLVAPLARRRGVARHLVEVMSEVARKRHQARELTVSCFHRNQAGLMLYPLLGFVPFATERRSEHDGNPAVLIHFRRACRPPATGQTTLLGILDDGWAGLSDTARQRLAAADLVIGAGRTLDLVRPYLAANAQLRDMDGQLGQVPGWIAAARETGHSVVALATGDPLCHGIASWLTGKLGPQGFEILPEVSTLQLAFARFKTAWQDIKIATCHTADAGEWLVGAPPSHGLYKLMRSIARHPRVALFTGPENTPARLARALILAGYEEDTRLSVACRLLLADETIYRYLSLAEAAEMDFPQPNVVLVERTAMAAPAFGLEDGEYIQRSPEKGLITKQEARALSLAKLRLKPDALVWDIGAGSGSVGLEAARLAPEGHIWAIEKNAGDAANARANAARFRVGNYTLVEGKAPQYLDGWPDPDAVFIGGSGGELAALIELILGRLKPGGRLVMNFVTLENLATATATLQAIGAAWEVVQLQASRSQPILDMHRMAAQNPVWIVTASKENP